MYPTPIQRAIDAFRHLPTVGPRTAARFAFYVLKAPNEEVDEFVKALLDLKLQTKPCDFCFNPFQTNGDSSEAGLCSICRDGSRDKTIVCVVEKESDLEALEKTNQYRGRYFILGGVRDILKKESSETMRVAELAERVATEVQEIILALNPTSEGETATLYLERALQPLGKKVTRLARGLPTGAELEYADDETIRSALDGRH